MSTIKIFINGEEREVPTRLNLEELILHFSLPSQRIAIELNKSVVRRNDWQNTIINDADTIEVIHFVGGG